MNRIINLSSFNSNNLQSLRAGSLLVQQIVEEQFSSLNQNKITDSKKIGVIATEKLIINNDKYLCVVSTLCEGLDFKKLVNFPLYDYNQEKTILLTHHCGTEVLPVVRVALNEEKNKILILSDNVKFDFFKFSDSKLKSASLLFQLISNENLIKNLSDRSISKFEEIHLKRPVNSQNTFLKSWRDKFILDQKSHLEEMQVYVNDIELIAHYTELLKLELNEKSI